MKNRITFKEFKAHMQLAGYTEKDIKQLFGAVKEMDRETRGWMIRWFWDGEYPKKEIEGVSFRFLVEDSGYKPLNAFIMLDWLKSDPDSAKFFMLYKPADRAPSEKASNKMAEILRKNGCEPVPMDGDITLDDIQE